MPGVRGDERGERDAAVRRDPNHLRGGWAPRIRGGVWTLPSRQRIAPRLVRDDDYYRELLEVYQKRAWPPPPAAVFAETGAFHCQWHDQRLMERPRRRVAFPRCAQCIGDEEGQQGMSWRGTEFENMEALNGGSTDDIERHIQCNVTREFALDHTGHSSDRPHWAAPKN